MQGIGISRSHIPFCRLRILEQPPPQHPALGLQGIHNLINALAVAMQQMGQQLNQRLDTMQRGAEQARAIHMNKSTFEDGHGLGAVKNLGGEAFPGGMAMVHETLLSYYLLLMPSSRTAVHYQPSTPSSY